MRATFLHGAFDIRVQETPDPTIQEPTDAIVRTVATCVCGSDLWGYRGVSAPPEEPRPIGHEFIGLVEEVGADVQHIKPGMFVIVPFMFSDGSCDRCHHGITTSCRHGGYWGEDSDGAQGEFVRVPLADGTLVATPEVPDDSMLPSLLSLTDVMGTGWHAAVSAKVSPGSTVAVVGDGAVGLSAVLAAKLQGAERIIAMSRNPARQALAQEFGATDLVATRGDEGIADVMELTRGHGVDAAMECVGAEKAMQQAFGVCRPGATVGFVGVPYGGSSVDMWTAFMNNISLAGGIAPVRTYMPDLLDRVLAGDINPGKVFDARVALDDIADGYKMMHTREAIKAFVLP